MSNHPRSGFTAVCGAAAAAALLAACGSSGGSPEASDAAAARVPTGTSVTGASVAGAPSAAPSAGTTAATTAATTAGKLPDVCAVLPVAKVSQLTGTSFTSSKGRQAAGVVASCDYEGAGAALLQVTVETQFGMHGLQDDVEALKTVGHPPTPLSGVGDAAYSEPDPKGNAGAAGAAAAASFGVVYGQVYIKIGGLTYVDAARGRQIAELLHAAM